jgi:hypothetical protein
MISSARPSSDIGTVIPSDLAVLRFDNQLDLRGLLHGKVGWLLALEDSAGVDAGKAIGINKARSVAEKQAATRSSSASSPALTGRAAIHRKMSANDPKADMNSPVSLRCGA